MQVSVDGPVGDRPLAERPERTLDVGRQRLVRPGGEVVEQVEVEEHDGDFALVVEPSDSSTRDTKR